MKKYNLGLYEKALPDFPEWEKKLLLTRECGFDWLEISVDESDKKLARLEYSQNQICEIQRASRNSGVPIRTMCLSGHRKFPLGSHDCDVRNRSLDIMERAVDLACELGVRLIQLAGYDVYYEAHDESTEQYFAENLQKAIDLAAKCGVTMGFETMETAFMDTVEKSMKYVNLVHSPYLGIYPDIGNLKNAAVLYGTNVADDIKAGTGHIFAAHLKETKPGVYRDLLFGSGGHTEYETCIQNLWEQGVRMYTGEFWYHGEPDFKENIQKAASFLRGKIKSACKEE